MKRYFLNLVFTAIFSILSTSILHATVLTDHVGSPTHFHPRTLTFQPATPAPSFFSQAIPKVKYGLLNGLSFSTGVSRFGLHVVAPTVGLYGIASGLGVIMTATLANAQIHQVFYAGMAIGQIFGIPVGIAALQEAHFANNSLNPAYERQNALESYKKGEIGFIRTCARIVGTLR